MIGEAYNPGMRLRLICMILSLSLLAGCTMWKQKGGWANATGGEQFVRLWWEDIKAKRTSDMEKRMAATYLAVSPQGTFDRAGALQLFTQMDIQDYALGDFVTQMNGPDMVVAYRATYTLKRAGQPSQVKARCLSVWQQTKTGWVVTTESAMPDQTP